VTLPGRRVEPQAPLELLDVGREPGGQALPGLGPVVATDCSSYRLRQPEATALDRLVQNPLACMVLTGEVADGSTVHLVVRKGASALAPQGAAGVDG
jgi:hypothetical protein